VPCGCDPGNPGKNLIQRRRFSQPSTSSQAAITTALRMKIGFLIGYLFTISSKAGKWCLETLRIFFCHPFGSSLNMLCMQAL